jgi:predicted CopG family antitoxin
MKRKTIWIDPEIWEQAIIKAKADRRDFIVILRRLLELWVKGEIDLKW